MTGTNSDGSITIAIVNWNTRDLLIQALQSIYCQEFVSPLRVVVVDNASKDGSAEAVRNRFPQCELIVNKENVGYARGNNQVLETTTSQFTLLLNPDVILPNHCLQTVVQFMHDHPNAGALGVKQVHPDGSLQRSVRGFPTPMGIFCDICGLSRLLPNNRRVGSYRMTWMDYSSVEEVDQPMGTFLLLRGTALESVGLLDEDFPIFFNEVDWCLRCKRAGWKIFYTPDVAIIHYGGAGTMQVGSAMAWESRRALLTFYKKHYSSALYLPIRLFIAIASWPHAWLQSRRRKRASK